MAVYMYWFVWALVLLGVEMATGTFYLLVVAIALAVGGVAALLGLGLSAQFLLAGVASIVGTVLLRRLKGGHDSTADSQNLDTGHPVKVLSWRDDGTARVAYRGAEWDAELDSVDAVREGAFYIKAIRGSILVLTPHKPV